MKRHILWSRKIKLGCWQEKYVFCSLLSYPLNNKTIDFVENYGADEKFRCLVLLQRRLGSTDTPPWPPPQRPWVHPEQGIAAPCWVLARSHSPLLPHTGVTLSSKTIYQIVFLKNGAMWDIFTSHFSCCRLLLLAVGYLLPWKSALSISFLGLYFTFNECFCNFMTVFWS